MSVLSGHENVDDRVSAGAQIYKNVAEKKPEVMRWISNNLRKVNFRMYKDSWTLKYFVGSKSKKDYVSIVPA